MYGLIESVTYNDVENLLILSASSPIILYLYNTAFSFFSLVLKPCSKTKFTEVSLENR